LVIDNFRIRYQR